MMLRRLRYLLRFRREGRELAEEIEFHRAMTEAQQRAAGLSAEEARDAAARVMGNVALARREARWVWLPGIARRSVWAFAAAAATVLLGIVANTVLRPWPVNDAGRIVSFGTTYDGVFSTVEYRYVSERSRAFVGVALQSGSLVTLDRQSQAYVHFVSGNYFSVVGAEMALGRGFTAEEEAVAVLGYKIWRVQYGGDPRILGRSIEMNGVPVTVVGVASKGFTGTNGRADVWAPLASMPSIQPAAREWLTSPVACCYVTARLAESVTREEGEAEIDRFSGQFRTNGGSRRRPRVIKFMDARPPSIWNALTRI